MQRNIILFCIPRKFIGLHAQCNGTYLFYLTASGDISMPNVLYHDLQSTVLKAYFTAAKFKVFTSEDLLYLFQLGSNQLA